jgi:4-hydroxyphenylpyruvate dioxygenase
MIPALSQICSLNAPFDLDVVEYAAGGCRAIEIWLGKLEQYLESHSVEDAQRLLRDQSVQAAVASYQGGLLTSQGEARREHWQHFRQRLALGKQLGVRTLVIAADIQGPLTQQDLDRASASLAEAATLAEQHDVRLALEFQAASAFGNNLQTAAAMVQQVGSPRLGICLDLFHFYCGPSKVEDLGLVVAENLFHVQLCDIADRPREMAADADRILPGDGDIPLAPVINRLREISYDGCVSIELMNPQLWQVPPRQFGEIGMTALRNVLELAE